MEIQGQAVITQPVQQAYKASENTVDAKTTQAFSSKTESQQKAELAQEQVDQKLIQALSTRDREVRAHEQAHKAVAGNLAISGPTYTYQKGPNGKLYAVGGEVKIDTAPVPNDPQATIEKAERIRRAALAPAEPSNQDRQVAAQAMQMALQARAELQAEKNQDTENSEKEQSTISSNITEQTSGDCAICGGAHSADTHILIGSAISPTK